MRRPPLPHKEEGGIEGEGEQKAQIAILESQIPNVPAAETENMVSRISPTATRNRKDSLAQVSSELAD